MSIVYPWTTFLLSMVRARVPPAIRGDARTRLTSSETEQFVIQEFHHFILTLSSLKNDHVSFASSWPISCHPVYSESNTLSHRHLSITYGRFIQFLSGLTLDPSPIIHKKLVSIGFPFSPTPVLQSVRGVCIRFIN